MNSPLKRLLAAQAEGWGIKLECPYCADDYTAIERYELKEWEGRGMAHCLFMRCEARDHTWSVRFGFHKGQTWLEVEP